MVEASGNTETREPDGDLVIIALAITSAKRQICPILHVPGVICSNNEREYIKCSKYAQWVEEVWVESNELEIHWKSKNVCERSKKIKSLI